MIDNTELTVGQMADYLGVTTRTLRHWDNIGLLVPSFRTWSDYRLYTEADIERAMQILVYREAGVPLKDIEEMLDKPGTVREHLRNQKRLLLEQIDHLHEMVRAVDTIMEGNLTMDEKVEVFGKKWHDYEEEAEARWGDTPEWAQAQERTAQMTREDWVKVVAEMEAFNRDVAAAKAAGVAPGSDAAKDLVARHRAQVERYYDCTLSKQVLLARLYVADERYRDMYTNPEYLLTLVEAEAAAAGIDLPSVGWGAGVADTRVELDELLHVLGSLGRVEVDLVEDKLRRYTIGLCCGEETIDEGRTRLRSCYRTDEERGIDVGC